MSHHYFLSASHDVIMTVNRADETHPGVGTLSGFTNHLHDEVSFCLEEERNTEPHFKSSQLKLNRSQPIKQIPLNVHFSKAN